MSVQHWQCSSCGSYYPLGATCGGCMKLPTVPIKQANVKIRYGVAYCAICGFAIQFCNGHGPTAPPAKDGAESDLERRIKACQ